MRRAAILLLSAALTVVATPEEASACSCAPLDPASALGQADAAFVGRLAEHPPGYGVAVDDIVYRFEVEEWVKGDLGDPIHVRAPAQGSAGGFEVAPGEEVGILLHLEGGLATGSLCTTMRAAALRAAAAPLVYDGSGPARFVVGGGTGPLRLALLDAEGGLLATAGGAGWLDQVAVCNRERRLVEVAANEVVVRDLATMGEVRSVDVAPIVQTAEIRGVFCRDEAADTVHLAVVEWPGETPVGRVVSIDALDRPLVEGPFEEIRPAADGWVAVQPGPQASVVWVDAYGTFTLLHTAPRSSDESAPFLSMAVDPSGTRVALGVTLHGGDGGRSRYVVYELTSREEVGRTEAMPVADMLGWLDETRFLVAMYLPGHERATVVSIDAADDRVTELPALPDLRPPLAADGVLYGVVDGRLTAFPLDDEPATVIRSLPSDQHRLLALLDDGPVVTAPPAPTVEIGPTVPPATLPPAGEPGWAGWQVAALVVLVLAAVALTLARRRSARTGAEWGDG